MKDGIRIFVAFLKQHILTLCTVCISFGIFIVVFSLYSLPLESIGYAALLTLVFLCIVGIIRFLSYYQRHKELKYIHEKVSVPNFELPVAKNLIEEDYHRIIKAIDADRAKITYAKDRAYHDMVEYYTIWAHQIKTPISAMRLLLQMESDNLPHKVQGELKEQLFKIEQYVEMVLQYVRLDHSSTDFLFQHYSLDDLVKQAIRKYAPSFIRKKIKLEYQPLNTQVLTDEKWLVFVIEQLLANALKYTHSGHVAIYMDPHEPCTLVIEDTGIGIEPEDLPRVFEQGYTGYNGRMDKKSTGIGLYICKKILDKLSHTIRLESTVGKGTRVRIGLDTVHLEKE